MTEQTVTIVYVTSHHAPIEENTATIGWQALAAQLTAVTEGHKSGQAWLPVTAKPGARCAANVTSVNAIVLDIEPKSRPAKDDNGKPITDHHGDRVKLIIGPLPPSISDLSAELTDARLAHIIATTYSHTPDAPRYRLILPIALPLAPAELRPIALHAASLLGLTDVTDHSAIEPARLYYLPRCPADRLQYFDSRVALDLPFAPVDEWQEEIKRITAASVAIDWRRQGAGSQKRGSVIDAWNNSTDLAAYLGSRGEYEARRGGRWLFSGSSTGAPGVRLLPAKGKWQKVYSSHANDPLSDGHAHDAFDCFRILEHSGDLKAAVRDAASTLGIPTGAPEKREHKAIQGHIATLADQATESKPTITITPDSLAANVSEIVAFLAREAKPTIYQSAGRLAAIVTSGDDVTISSHTPNSLAATLGSLLACRRWSDKKEDFIAINPPIALCSALIDSPALWHGIPQLHAISNSPALDSAGNLVPAPGYNPATCTYLTGRWPAITLPDNPTRDDARAARVRILDTFKEFPVQDRHVAHSVLMSYIMTMTVRHELDTSPLYIVSSPTPGSGKTYLATIANIIATGKRPKLLTAPANHRNELHEEELEKRLIGLLASGASSVCIDNVTSTLAGDALNAIITAGEVTCRLLGSSKIITTRAAMTLVASGNNLSVADDMTRRSLSIVIDTGLERPDKRTFATPDLESIALSKRGQLLTDLLTIRKAWLRAGSPATQIPPMPSFVRWSTTVRDPLIWIGMPDPAESQKSIIQKDSVMSDLDELITAWHEAIGDRHTRIADVATTIDTKTSDPGINNLRNALTDAGLCRDSTVDRRRLGKYLARYADRVCGGFVIRLGMEKHTKVRTFSVSPVFGASQTLDETK